MTAYAILDGAGNLRDDGEDIEALIRLAAIAAEMGRAATIARTEDDELMATIFPDGKIDLTWEGSKVG